MTNQNNSYFPIFVQYEDQEHPTEVKTSKDLRKGVDMKVVSITTSKSNSSSDQ